MTDVTVIIDGVIGQVGEKRVTPNTQTSVIEMAVATHRKKGDEEITDWHKVTVFGKSADYLADNAQAGDSLYVKGDLSYSQWEKEGQKHKDAVVTAQRTRFFKKAA